MGKITRVKLFRFIFLVLVMSTLLFSFNNVLQNIEVQNNELVLTFQQAYAKNRVKYFYLKRPSRHVFDFSGLHLGKYVRMQCHINHVRIAQYNANTVRIVIENESPYALTAYKPILSKNEYHISLPKTFFPPVPKPIKKVDRRRTVNEIFADLENMEHRNVYKYPKEKVAAKKAVKVKPRFKERVQQKVQASKKVKEKPVYHRRSHKQDLIVIDAGHGGHDSGAVGGRKREKDLVLSIAKKVSLFLKRQGYRVYMTRKTDRFLKLSERTRIADRKGAVAFISIHANSVPKRRRSIVHGIETFFLQTTRDAKSQRIARRENAALLRHSGTSLSKAVIIDSVLNGPKIIESNKLAIDVQRRIMTKVRSRYKGVKDGGVRHAPFYVLVGASRPSILVEVGYISHPRERKRLFTPLYQNLIAKGIAQGVNRYLNNRKKEIDFD